MRRVVLHALAAALTAVCFGPASVRAASVPVPISFSISNVSVTANVTTSPMGGMTGQILIQSDGNTRDTLKMNNQTAGSFVGTTFNQIDGVINLAHGAVMGGTLSIGARNSVNNSFDTFSLQFGKTMSSGIVNQATGYNFNLPTIGGHFSGPTFAGNSLNAVDWQSAMSGAFLALSMHPSGNIDSNADFLLANYASAVPTPEAFSGGLLVLGGVWVTRKFTKRHEH